MATTGFTRAAAITAALAFLAPGGVIGGIAFLGVIGVASDALTKYGLSAILKEVYLERKKKGDSTQSLSKEINGLPIYNDLKRELKEAVGFL